MLRSCPRGALGPLRVPARSPRSGADEHPAAAIVKLARAKRADLIALTSHGRGGSRLVIGSVTDKVLRTSTLPLLLSRSRADHSLDVGETPMKER